MAAKYKEKRILCHSLTFNILYVNKFILHFAQEENSQLIESLRSALRQQQAEVEQLRHQLESVNTEKSQLSKSHEEL